MDLQTLLQNPPKLHFSHSAQPICCTLRPDALRFIHENVKPSFSTLETGAGLTTVVFAMTGAQHLCVVQAADQAVSITNYCAQHRISLDKVTFQIQRSEEALPTLDLPQLDFVLLDGRHAFPSPFIDWYYTAKALRPGGMMMIDDTNIWTGYVLKKFLLGESNWDLVHDFAPRTVIFSPRAPVVHGEGWNEQPWVVKESLRIQRRIRLGMAREQLLRGRLISAMSNAVAALTSK